MNDGREQVEQYSKLWQPDELAGYKVGDMVRLPSISGALEIVALKPPSLLVLRTPNGGTVQAGYRAVSRAHLHDTSDKWRKAKGAHNG